jgi:hypothetical protein
MYSFGVVIEFFMDNDLLGMEEFEMKNTAIIAMLFLLIISTPTLAFQENKSVNHQSQVANNGSKQPVDQKDTKKSFIQKMISSEVKRGQDITLDIGAGLVFCLVASHDPAIEGWDIRIFPKGGSKHNYAWQLNPPYRGYNAADLSVSYNFTAKDVIQQNPRKLRFPLSELDAKKAEELVETLLSAEGPQFDEAERVMENMPSGNAVFNAIDSKLGKSGPENGERGRIEWLKFELTVSLPCSVADKK